MAAAPINLSNEIRDLHSSIQVAHRHFATSSIREKSTAVFVCAQTLAELQEKTRAAKDAVAQKAVALLAMDLDTLAIRVDIANRKLEKALPRPRPAFMSPIAQPRPATTSQSRSDKARCLVLKDGFWMVGHLVPKHLEPALDAVFAPSHADVSVLQICSDRTAVGSKGFKASGKLFDEDGRGTLSGDACLGRLIDFSPFIHLQRRPVSSMKTLKTGVRHVQVSDVTRQCFKIRQLKHVPTKDSSVFLLETDKRNMRLSVMDNLVVTKPYLPHTRIDPQALNPDLFKQLTQLFSHVKVAKTPSKKPTSATQTHAVDPKISEDHIRSLCNNSELWKSDREAMSIVNKARLLLETDIEAARRIVYLLIVYKQTLLPLKPTTGNPTEQAIFSKAVLALRQEVQSIYKLAKHTSSRL